MSDKTFNNINSADAQNKINDIEFFGDCDRWKLLCKASSKSEGWMKSTKAMEIDGVGCLVQVTTQQQNPDGSYAITEAMEFVPNTRIKTQTDVDMNVLGRKLVSTDYATQLANKYAQEEDN